MTDECEGNIEYSKTISENLEKGFQIRLVASTFREVTYLQLRKYFLSYEGEWLPSKQGVSMEAGIENIYGLLDGLLDLLSKAEGDDIIEIYYRKICRQKSNPS